MSTTDDDWGLKPEFKGKRRVAHVGHSKDGFTLHVVAEPIFRAWVTSLADSACSITRHRFCNLFGKVWEWESNKEITLTSFPITEEQARAMDFHHDSWFYLKPDEDEDEEAAS